MYRGAIGSDTQLALRWNGLNNSSINSYSFLQPFNYTLSLHRAVCGGSASGVTVNVLFIFADFSHYRKDLIMPIIFVHGVSSRMGRAHDRAWEETRANLRKYIAPVISASGDADDVLIDNAFWGELSVPLLQGKRSSLPDDKRVQAIFKRKKGWIDRKVAEFQKIPDSDKAEYLLDLIPEVGKKLHDLPGYFFGRFVDSLRQPLNESVTLFLGDVFFYLAKRGTADNPGKISNQLLNSLEKAHKDKIEKDEKLMALLG
jgi:hypothetical protein